MTDLRRWGRADWLLLLLGGLLCYISGRLGMATLVLQPSNITLLWLPSGIGVILCLRFGTVAIIPLFIASFLANFPGLNSSNLQQAQLHTWISAAIDALMPLLAARMLRWALPMGLQRARELLLFGFYVCVIPVALSSILLALNLVWGGYIDQSSWPTMAVMLFLADSLGIVLVYQVYLGWSERFFINQRQIRASLLSILTLVVIFTLAFGNQPWVLYLLLPVLVMQAFEGSFLLTCSLSSGSFAVVIYVSAKGLGPFDAGLYSAETAELAAFCFANALVLLGIALQNRQLRLSEQHRDAWQQVAFRDPLTGLLNRRGFEPQLELVDKQARLNREDYSLALLDLDHFKLINDSFGHATGDKVLKQLAGLMQAQCRQSDAIARIGGEEFAILLPNCAPAQAVNLMERLRARVDDEDFHDESGQPIRLSISVGLVSGPAGCRSGKDLQDKADHFLYVAKAEGRNRVVQG
ncbi:MAG: diguanylate cyclase [Shewanella indica]|uniref:GGDEF domain-containing protein n=1 Tax=Shewanella indica TaxID=768528 RepID=UPI00399B48EF